MQVRQKYNGMMTYVAAIALISTCLLSAAAVLSFSWSIASAKVFLRLAQVAAVVGVAATGVTAGRGAIATWEFLFACAACGCFLNAARYLSTRPTRWIHRYVIYAGYGSTFALMAGAGSPLEARSASGWTAAAVFFAIYVAGSVCIFVAKTLTVRRAVKTMPEYQSSLGGGPGEANAPTYW
jgi:hypothetical protein